MKKSKTSNQIANINEDMIIQVPKKKERVKVNSQVAFLLAIVIMICLSFYFVTDAMSSGANVAAETFIKTKDDRAEITYEAFYDTAFEYSEKAHHVSSDVAIDIGNIKEEQKLEVLKVYDVTYEISEENADVESWLEVPAYAVFTVDLRKSEFIVDNYNQYVLVRVATPTLSQFTLDHRNIKSLNFEEGWFDDAEEGVEMAKEQTKNAENKLKIAMMNNQENYLRAEKSARIILSNMIRQLNPQLAELIVEVEFIK